MHPSASNPEHVLRPPRLNGRYVVTRLLGKGAQARVYLAWDSRLKQWRAVKVLAANFVSDEHVRHRFETEAEAMARLSHRNLLRVVDIDSDGGTPFIVMELARGGAITDWLKRHGVMYPRLACEVLAQACEGLAHAHAVGVVHRDVKPHNLLIADDGRVLLTDFGIAQLAEGAGMTQTGSVMGTFAYMAPEQRNDAKSVDGRADVYALGATLYTILTLKTSAELFFAEARDEILEPVPEGLRDIILNACRYDRDDRLPDVHALRERLLEAMESMDAFDGPPLTDHILPLPETPAPLLDADSGVEDLQKALALRDGDAPTYIPRARLDQLLEEQSTTLYSDTGVDEQQPTTLPYRMPERGREPRMGVEELSDDDVPGYYEVSTMDRQPSTSPVPPSQTEYVISPPPAVSVRAAPLHTAQPAATRAPNPPPALMRWFALGCIVVFSLFALIAGYGVVDKSAASLEHRRASAALILAAQEPHGMIEALRRAGATEEPLRERWFAYDDAEAHVKARQAAAFAEAVIQASGQVDLEGIARVQVQQLDSARRDWMIAERKLHRARRSVPGLLTGDLGIVR